MKSIIRWFYAVTNKIFADSNIIDYTCKSLSEIWFYNEEID